MSSNVTAKITRKRLINLDNRLGVGGSGSDGADVTVVVADVVVGSGGGVGCGVAVDVMGKSSAPDSLAHQHNTTDTGEDINPRGKNILVSTKKIMGRY